MNNDLIKLLALEAAEIEFRFEKARLEGRGTPQEVSDRREAVVRGFFEKYFPYPSRIAKGNILDSSGGKSASIDCVILSPHHPHTVSEGALFSTILAEGVDFAIEVKPDLTSCAELERGLAQVYSVKSLNRVGAMFSERNKGRCGKIPSLIFSMRAPKDLDVLLGNIVAYYECEKIGRSGQFDMLVVNNRFVVLNVGRGSQIGFIDSNFSGLAVTEAKSNTLASMLFHMNCLPSHYPSRSAEIMIPYFLPAAFGVLRFNEELNSILNEVERDCQK